MSLLSFLKIVMFCAIPLLIAVTGVSMIAKLLITTKLIAFIVAFIVSIFIAKLLITTKLIAFIVAFIVSIFAVYVEIKWIKFLVKKDLL